MATYTARCGIDFACEVEDCTDGCDRLWTVYCPINSGSDDYEQIERLKEIDEENRK